MKAIYHVKTAILFAVFSITFTACQEESSTILSTDEATYETLMKSINKLNSKYSIAPLSHELVLDTEPYYPNGLNRQRWDLVYSDFDYAATGMYGGVQFGRWFGVKGAIIGGAIGAIAGAISGSVDFIKYSPYYPPLPDDPYCPGCGWAYMVDTDNPVNFNYIKLDKFSYDINLQDIFPAGYITDQIGNRIEINKIGDVGILHNHIIQKMYLENPEFIYQADFDAIVDKAFDILEDIGFELSAQAPGFREEMTTYIQECNYTGSLSDKGIPNETAQILDSYFESVSQLSTSNAISYTQEFQAIASEELDPESIDYSLIIAATSVAVNSKMLWNLNLPDPYDTDLSLTYANGQWNLITKTELLAAITAGEALIWGIPKIVNNQITKLFFYKSLDDEKLYLDSDAVENFLGGNDFYRLEENIELVHPLTKATINLSEGNYPIGRDPQEGIVAICFNK